VFVDRRRWLNQVEIYFSIVQPKVLQPNDFENLAELVRTLNEFEHDYNLVARPWTADFTRDDLSAVLERLTSREPRPRLAA
jgi:hypothetical protein